MHTPTKKLDELFSNQEIDQFEQDDSKAGFLLCSMLTVFFLYTVLVMAFTVSWTMNQLAG